MDRRTFLKTLSALVGSALALPADLASASDAQVDAAWRQVGGDWDLFEVGPSGTLSDARFEPPATRRDAYDLDFITHFDNEEIERTESLQYHVERLCGDWLDAHPQCAGTPAYEAATEDDWKAWADSLDAEDRRWLDAGIEDWLDAPPDMNFEWDELQFDATAQGRAYNHFNNHADPNMMDALNIVVIDGCCPGSTYYAAELRMDLDEANRLAAEQGWSVRFVWEAWLLEKRG